MNVNTNNIPVQKSLYLATSTNEEKRSEKNIQQLSPCSSSIQLIAANSLNQLEKNKTFLSTSTQPLEGLATTTSEVNLKEEFLFENAPFKHCHASTIVQTASGELLVAFFGGTKKGDPVRSIWACRQKEGKWSEPVLVASANNVSCGDPVLFKMPDGEILLFYKVGPSPREWHGMMKRSKDNGQTWSEPEKLPDGILGPTKNKPLLLGESTLLCPSSHELMPQGTGSWYCEMNITNDRGKTWQKSEAIAYPDPEKKNPLAGIIQPTLFVDDKGVIHMLCRSRGVGTICHATSLDKGVHWSKVEKTTLENPNCAIDCVKLKNGKIMLICNPVKEHRNKLAMFLSDDDGKTWKEGRILENHEQQEYSFPAIIQTADGSIHITYSYERDKIKHVTLPLQ